MPVNYMLCTSRTSQVDQNVSQTLFILRTAIIVIFNKSSDGPKRFVALTMFEVNITLTRTI